MSMQCVVVLVDLLAYLSAEFLPLSREGGNPVEAESGLGEKRRDSAAWGWQEGSRAGGHSMLILEQLPAAYVVSLSPLSSLLGQIFIFTE